MHSLKRGFLNFGLSLALASSLAYGGTVMAAGGDDHQHGYGYVFDDDDFRGFYFIGGKQLGVLIENDESQGLKVSKVLKGSAAEKAGIKAGDVITAIGGQTVGTLSDVRRRLKEVEFGKPFDVSVQRDGASLQLSATLEKFRWNTEEHARMMEKAHAARKKALEAGMFTSRGRLGVSTQELTEQLRDYFGVANGVLVTSVNENTPASSAGLKAGDIITSVNGAKISDTGDIRNELRKIESGDCNLTVVRKGKTLQLKATLEPRKSHFELMPEMVLPLELEIKMPEIKIQLPRDWKAII